MLHGVPPRVIAQQVNKTPVVVSNIIGKVYAHLGAARDQRGLAVFEQTHRGGLVQLFLDVKAAQALKAQSPRVRTLTDQPFDQTRLIGLTDQQFQMLQHILAGTTDHSALAAAMRLPEKTSREVKFKLLRKLNISGLEQLSSYPGGLTRLKRDVAHRDAIEHQRDPWLKTLLPTRFELLYNDWVFGMDAQATARLQGGRPDVYARYLDEMNAQPGLHAPGQLAQRGGAARALREALQIEKQARYIGHATMAQLLEQPHVVRRAMAGIQVKGRFDPQTDIQRLTQRWGGHIEVDDQNGLKTLYWQPSPSDPPQP